MIVALLISIAIILSAGLTAWAALIVESLASGGSSQPYFAGLLEFRGIPQDDDLITVTAPFPFVDSTGKRHVTPAEMDSDGASVGQLMWIPLIGWLTRLVLGGGPLEGVFRPAAIPHDGLYAQASDSSWFRALISLKRAEADRVIYEAAMTREYRLPNGKVITRRPAHWWQAFAVMALLRVAGGKAWMDDFSKAQLSLKRIAAAAKA